VGAAAVGVVGMDGLATVATNLWFIKICKEEWDGDKSTPVWCGEHISELPDLNLGVVGVVGGGLDWVGWGGVYVRI
jgi:hypothetical protein